MQEAQTTNIIGFKESDIQNIVKDLGLKLIKKDNKNCVSKDGEHIEQCEICKETITAGNLGSIAKGSNLLFCDNPICFISYLETKK